jgi:hypothetical protein
LISHLDVLVQLGRVHALCRPRRIYLTSLRNGSFPYVPAGWNMSTRWFGSLEINHTQRFVPLKSGEMTDIWLYEGSLSVGMCVESLVSLPILAIVDAIKVSIRLVSLKNWDPLSVVAIATSIAPDVGLTPSLSARMSSKLHVAFSNTQSWCAPANF